MEEKEAPTPFQKPNISQNDIKFIDEYRINLENKIYVLKIGKLTSDVEELTIFAKNENEIGREYYQNNFPLEKLYKENKILRQFDTIDEIIDALKEIISEKNMVLKIVNNTLLITFKMKKLGKGEEEVNLTLTKNNIEIGKMVDILLSNMNKFKSDLEHLKEQVKLKKIKKYSPTLENGWKIDPYVPAEFTVFKNNDGQVTIQGSVSGDWSKKIFTLEKEFRPKYRLCFPVMANLAFNRLDIDPNGDVYLSADCSLGIKGSGWVRFDGINYYISE